MTRFLIAILVVLLSATAARAAVHAETRTKARTIVRGRHQVATLPARREKWRDFREHRRDVRRAAIAAAAEPEPAPTYDPTPTSTGCLSDAAIAAYAAGAGFPPSVVPTMVYIAAHRNGTGESGGCPGAINPSSGACGLWQIYPAQPGCTDPATNAALAYSKYRSGGLSPWGM